MRLCFVVRKIVLWVDMSRMVLTFAERKGIFIMATEMQEIAFGNETRELPLIPLRNTVIFPVLTVPLSVGRPDSLKALRRAMEEDRVIVVVSQRQAEDDHPNVEALYKMGVICRVIKTIQTAEGHQSVIIQGLQRCEIESLLNEDSKGYSVLAKPISTLEVNSVEEKAALIAVKELAFKAIELNPAIPDEAHAFIEQIEEGSAVADIIASNLQISTAEKQEILEVINLQDRLHRVGALLSNEVSVLELSQKIKSDVKGEIDKSQREYFLREQLKAIRRELGEEDSIEGEQDELSEKVDARGFPEKVLEVARKELGRLGRIPSQSPEYSVIRTYLDWLLDLPWHEVTDDKIELQRVQKILDEDHFDLDKVKKRIIEYLAVLKLKKTIKGPILCLVGPPGVGKTSLGKSIARALDRKFVRISLGGIHDEAEIRGHRRTYIGAMPGRIVLGMKKAGSVNPVFVLDEIDKVGQDFRGDPSSALLEVLDPEQNETFSDNYLEVEYDLSQVMFIATANRADTIPPALLDRMEVIEIEGYTDRDKYHIARNHLLPEVLEENGLEDWPIHFEDMALRSLIEKYTREAGVRTLKRELSSLARGLAHRIVEQGDSAPGEDIQVTPEDLEELLGPQKFFRDISEQIRYTGVAVGMAWTPVGGDILFIEAKKMPGKGGLLLTGKLGDVMKESARLAMSYIKANAVDFGLDEKELQRTDVHLHVPEGAIPKDGPSAGVTILAALVSLFTGRRIKSRLAMTGEITLRGNVLPVGGIKSKVIAAARAGITTILLPEQNRRDLRDIPEEIQNSVQIKFLPSMDKYLKAALRSTRSVN